MLEALTTIVVIYSIVLFANHSMLEALQKDALGGAKPRHKSAD
jgi:hypothetical protein